MQIVSVVNAPVQQPAAAPAANPTPVATRARPRREATRLHFSRGQLGELSDEQIQQVNAIIREHLTAEPRSSTRTVSELIKVNTQIDISYRTLKDYFNHLGYFYDFKKYQYLKSTSH